MLNVTLKKRQQQSCIRSCCMSSWLRAGPPLPALPSDIGIFFWQSNRSHHTVHRQHRPTLRGNSFETYDFQCTEHTRSQAIDFLLFFTVLFLQKCPTANIGAINHGINKLFLTVCSGQTWKWHIIPPLLLISFKNMKNKTEHKVQFLLNNIITMY